MVVLTAASFTPLDTFRLRWRWTDPRWDLLPLDSLATICPLVPARAAELAHAIAPVDQELWRLALAPAQRAPQASGTSFVSAARFDTAAAEPARIAAWLREQTGDDDTTIAVLWDDETAVLTTWRVFAASWDAFCYPSSDNVTIIPPNGAWLLRYHHEEVFVLGRWRTPALLFRVE